VYIGYFTWVDSDGQIHFIKISMDTTSALDNTTIRLIKKANPFHNFLIANANLSIGVLYKQAVIYIFILALIEAASPELKKRHLP
jgi:hypothetical protein